VYSSGLDKQPSRTSFRGVTTLYQGFLFIIVLDTPCRPYAHALPGDDDDRSVTHRIRMAFDQGSHGVRSLHRGHFDKPHDPRMRQAALEDKLSEVLVLGDEHATLFPGERQQRFV